MATSHPTCYYTSLPPTITSRILPINGVSLHILESLPTTTTSSPPPLVLLLHGFPELSLSWRHIIPELAAAGFHVVAPDQRGYPPSSPVVSYEDDLAPYAMPQLVEDIRTLVYALGYTQAAAIVGHDFGSLVAGFTALAHPDLTRTLVLMSAPFTGTAPAPLSFNANLNALGYKHNSEYFSSPTADAEMREPPEGLHAFLRAYFHVKSGDWAENSPHPLSTPSAHDMVATLPHYYVMPLHADMPAVVRPHAPPGDAECAWLPNVDLDVYVREFGRKGFQGSLNWYRALRTPSLLTPFASLAGKTIPWEVRALFISGQKDWGVWQTPGAVDRMRAVCEGMAEGSEGLVLVDGAGHWVQQERPKEIATILLEFLRKA